MNIAVLGAGNMGKAIIGGLLRRYGSEVTVTAWDKIDALLATLASAVKIAQPGTWFNGNDAPDAVIIAVKPADIASALAPLQAANKDALLKPLWISIAAGKSISFFAGILPAGARICRVMPNTPALIEEGISAYSLSENAAPFDTEIIGKILSACGKAVAVPEKQMNAVTGLSGSGPAYVFYFIESLIEGGVIAGLPYQTARELALQTVLGAAKMASMSSDNLAGLKMKVMTPAGTTASACLTLEQNSFKHGIIKAVLAAATRSEAMEK